MSTHEITSVLHALRTIETVPNEALRTYNAEVKAVFHKLRVVIAQNTTSVDEGTPLDNQDTLRTNTSEPSIGQVRH